jgi:hypothetical protein
LHFAGSLAAAQERAAKVSRQAVALSAWAWIKLELNLESKIMKIMAALFLAMFTVMPVEAGPQPARGSLHHDSVFRSRSAATHFVARSGDGFHRRFHYGAGGVVIFDDDGSDYSLPDDDPVYQGQLAPQDEASLPYATPTSDPDTVISPYEPHATIGVAGVPHGAKVQDPASNLIFLNP